MLALVIAGARIEWVDAPPVAFGLGMLVRVALDFRSGGLENACLHMPGQPKHVDRPADAGLGGLHRVMLAMNGQSKAGKVKMRSTSI